MQQTMSMDTHVDTHVDMPVDMSADMSGCDLMKSPSADHAKLKGVSCKVTAQCQFGSLYHPAVQVSVSRPAVLIMPVISHYADSLPVRDPNGLLRPPRPI